MIKEYLRSESHLVSGRPTGGLIRRANVVDKLSAVGYRNLHGSIRVVRMGIPLPHRRKSSLWVSVRVAIRQRTGLYADSISTDGGEFQCDIPVCTCVGRRQTIEHQRSHAEAAGFKIDEVIADHGVSGVTTKLADRPGGRRLLDKVRAEIKSLSAGWIDSDATTTTRPRRSGI